MTPANLSAMPDRTLEQRQDALSEANEVRSYRAGVKRTLRLVEPEMSRRTAAQIIMEPPPKMLTMKVYALLMSVPKFGQVRVNRILRKSFCSPSKTLGGLTQRQRLSLRAELL